MVNVTDVNGREEEEECKSIILLNGAYTVGKEERMLMVGFYYNSDLEYTKLEWDGINVSSNGEIRK